MGRDDWMFSSRDRPADARSKDVHALPVQKLGVIDPEYGPAVSRRDAVIKANTAATPPPAVSEGEAEDGESPSAEGYVPRGDSIANDASEAVGGDFPVDSQDEAKQVGLDAPHADASGTAQPSSAPKSRVGRKKAGWKPKKEKSAKATTGADKSSTKKAARQKREATNDGVVSTNASTSGSSAATGAPVRASTIHGVTYVGCIGGTWPNCGPGPFDRPGWLAPLADGSGDLVVSSTFAHKVLHLSSRRVVEQEVLRASDGSLLFNPQGIAVGESIDNDEDRVVYVADGGNHRVCKYTFDAAERVCQPTLCSPNDVLRRPLGLALEEPLLFVADSVENCVVALMSETLLPVFSFGREEGPGRLRAPMGIAIHRPHASATDEKPRSLIFVADREHHMILAFDIDGRFVRSIGAGNARKGVAPGEFSEPLGVAADAECIYVCEGLGARLQVLTPEGVPLYVLPVPGHSRLCGVMVEGERVVITEFEANRLHEFRLVRAQKLLSC